MKAIELHALAGWAKGRLIGGEAVGSVSRIATDSRQLHKGDVFVALRGEKFDGHAFAQKAKQSGAVCAIVERAPEGLSGPEFGVIETEDTLNALQSIAGVWRKSLGVKVVAITGSNGKTSVKEFVWGVLSQKFKTHKTFGNYNNHIGVPLTLLGIEEDHDWAVVEVGMNHPGEIAPLAALARPDIGIVTSVGWAHIEFFKDRAAVAREKAELTRVLGPEGIAVLNGDDGLVKAMASTTNARILFAGGDSGACCRYENLVCTEEGMCFRLITPRGDTDVKLRAHGRHMVANATLAAAAGYGVGLDVEAIRRGLELVKLPSNRFRVSRFREGWLVDDSYNASPDSTLAAFETLRLLPGNGRLVALLGTMGELGDYALELHREVGKKAGQLGFDVLFCLGPHATALVDGALQGGMDESRVDFFESHEGLAQRYASTALAGDRILVKGSRARRMETVVDLLNGEK